VAESRNSIFEGAPRLIEQEGRGDLNKKKRGGKKIGQS